MRGAGDAFALVLDSSEWLGVLIGAAVVLAYTWLGGYLAASITDTLQGVLMAMVAVLLPAAALIQLGGVAPFLEGMAQVGLGQRLEQPRALEQEKELHRQRIARHVVVEAREERILVRLLEHQVRAQARGEAAREAGLARADRSLHHQVPEFIHGTRSTRRP
jgi:Na+(H+)/acetate symporter ActP